MVSKSISRYIAFGTCLRYLQDVGEGTPVHGRGRVQDNIVNFLKYLQEFNLYVTIRAAYKLEILEDRLKKTPPNFVLSQKLSEELREVMESIRNTLFAEAEGNIAFIVTDKRIDIKKLLSDIPGLFALHVYSRLPEIAQKDFTQAGRCISFELPTAAAFHLLRGTEAILRHFYLCIVKRKRVKPLLWGPMVQALRARRKPPNEILLNNLDNIRHSFRNPTLHPEKCYDIDQVQDLFSLCVDVVNRMANSKVCIGN